MSSELATLNGRHYRTLIFVIVIASMTYLSMLMATGFTDVINAVSMVGGGAIVIALGLSLLNLGLRFLRWQYFLRITGSDIHFLPSLKIYISGFALTASPAKAGEMIRSILLKPYGLRYTKSIALFFTDRMSDLIAVLALVTLGLWKHDELFSITSVSLSMLIICSVLVLVPGSVSRASVWAARKFPLRFRSALLNLARILRTMNTCLSGRNLVLGFVLGLLAWTSQGFVLFYIAKFMGMSLTMLDAVLVHSFSILLGALSFLPGGIVVTDMSITGILMLLDFDASQAVACAILVRLLTLWFAIALGVLALSRTRHPIQ